MVMGNIQTYCLNYNNQYNTIQKKITRFFLIRVL